MPLLVAQDVEGALGKLAYAIACVTIFGSVATFAYPALSGLLHLDALAYGLWSGSSAFLGSGSTLIAAESTRRVCCGVELDPLYVDVIIRRYEAATDTAAILADTGETFATVALRRCNRDGNRSQ